MKQAATRELYGYWARLRGSRSAPERGDIDPAAIRSVLSDTFILEADCHVPEPVFPIRLSGTRLNALFLDELKSRPFLSMWARDTQPSVRRLLASVLDDVEPLVAGVRSGPAGHRPIDLEMVLLPLRHHGRTHARVLGSIAPIEIPSWLGLLPVQPFTLSSVRLLGDETPLQEEFTTAGAAHAPPRRYGNLVVHQGGR